MSYFVPRWLPATPGSLKGEGIAMAQSTTTPSVKDDTLASSTIFAGRLIGSFALAGVMRKHWDRAINDQDVHARIVEILREEVPEVEYPFVLAPTVDNAALRKLLSAIKVDPSEEAAALELFADPVWLIKLLEVVQSKRVRKILALSSGLTTDGNMSVAEVSGVMAVSVYTVRKHVRQAYYFIAQRYRFVLYEPVLESDPDSIRKLGLSDRAEAALVREGIATVTEAIKAFAFELGESDSVDPRSDRLIDIRIEVLRKLEPFCRV